MAVNITQQPTTPNAAYTRLPYVVSGSITTSNPQYQYVMDIYESGSSDLISRVTQTKNPNGVAVFDPSRIFQGELEEDHNWKIPFIENSENSNKVFTLKFGEQYGTSISSSITVYPDLDTTEISVFPATNNLNLQDNPFLSGSYLDITQSGWNFPIINFQPSTASATVFSDCLLTNNPYLQGLERQTFFPELTTTPEAYDPHPPVLVGEDDYFTISRLRGELFPNPTGTYMSVYIFSGSTRVGFGNKGNAPQGVYVLNFGVGPANIKAAKGGWDNVAGTDPADVILSGSWTNYTVITGVIASGSLGQSDISYFVNDKSDLSNIQNFNTFSDAQPIYNLKLPDGVPDTCGERTRFAWINNFGQWDYYTIYNPVRRQSDIQRENVTLPQLDYSGISSPYNISNRGQKDYYTQVKDRFEITTAYIQKPEAQWLEELLESPSVYVQKGDCFVPIVVTNAQYQHNNNTSRNKLFQYTIQFEPSNQPYGDWDTIPTECSGSVNVPTPTFTPTPSPIPTNTLTPTPTVGPTSTPTPTGTPTPTPIPEYYTLYRCTDGETNLRDEFPTTATPGLIVGSQVRDNSFPFIYYTVIGTTTDTGIPNVGAIQYMETTGCP